MQQSCPYDLCGGREVNSRPLPRLWEGEQVTAPPIPITRFFL